MIKRLLQQRRIEFEFLHHPKGLSLSIDKRQTREQAASQIKPFFFFRYDNCSTPLANIFFFQRFPCFAAVSYTHLSRADDRKASRIYFSADNMDVSNENDWPRMAEFHATATAEMRKAFSPLLEEYFRNA